MILIQPGFLFRFILPSLLCTLFLVSCGTEEHVELRPAEGGKFYGGIYRMNETDAIKTLDPVGLNDAPSHHVVHQIADQLVDFDSSLTLQPELAEKWEISEDQLTYTYHLRKGVLFHDNPCFPDGKGREMKASDVKFCFDRILDARSGTKGADYFRDKVVGAQDFFDATAKNDGQVPEGGVPGFKAVDDYTFQIQLLHPFPAFKYYPALGMTYIYPPEAVEKYGQDFFRNIVATGPFVLKSWEADRELILERNPNYWRKDEHGNQLPFLDSIQFTFKKEQATMLTEFTKGNLEENYRIPPEFVETIFEKREIGSTAPWKLTGNYTKFTLHVIPSIATNYYGMLTIDPVFQDKRIRQAFNYAIDRERIIAFVLKGQAAGPANHGLVPPAMPNYPAEMVKGYNFDVAKAKALMAEAGYPDGKGFPAISLQLNSGGGLNEKVADAIQDQLKKNLGIEIEMKQVQFAQHLDMIDKGEAALFRLAWIADYPEPENFLNLLWGKNAAPKGKISPINSTRYNNPEFDALFEQAMRTPDDTERYRLYAQAEQIAVDDAPMLWIYHSLDFRLVQPYVRGYSSNPMDRRDLVGVWLDYNATEGGS
ncbi:MAG: ABC transporter substrate-binding protein [Candidatus Kapaibacterium sp.]